MPGTNLYTSNRMEVLVSLLSSTIVQNPLPFFEEEIVLIQNRGMQRWLSMEISKKLGVCLNFRFPFPNAFIQEIFSKVIPDIPDRLPLDPEFMVWKIAGILPGLLSKPSFKEVRSYFKTHGFTGVSSDKDSEKLQSIKIFQFAKKIADQFDHYTIYRPEMLLNWEQGRDEHWQAELWRNLTAGSTLHMAKLRKQLLETVSADFNSDIMPTRITIFGISALPPFYTSIFIALSKFIEVNFFILNPSAEYWDDILSEKEIQVFLRKQAKKKRVSNLSVNDLHLEQGNPLLASMGRYGRDFLSLLHEFSPEEYSYPIEIESETLLSSLHSRILRFDQNDTVSTVEKEDRSIQIHSCHNPMREVEILHDNILGFFQKTPHLQPSDIVVMTPDIEKYAPYIHAVFGCPEDNEIKIPYSIADRTGGSTNNFASVFMSLLEVATSRYTITAILDILQNDEIRKTFQITDDDFKLLRSWIQNTGIRWGIDQTSRELLNLPPSVENTWKAGIESLLLGYALPSEGTHSFHDIAGFDHLEGSQGETLGKLLDFFTTLVELTKKCEQNFSLKEWSEVLLHFFDRFFNNSSGSEQELINIRSILIDISELQKETLFSEPVPLEVIKLFLQSKFSTLLSKPGFITGAVTFCAMLPMRSIPFKIVCILGLNNDSYPRKSTNSSWDLITANPQKGDRSLELEDRYLFLEALLSAREIFYISYTGINSNKNSVQYPSVLVEELLDYIDKTFYIESDSTYVDTLQPVVSDTESTSESALSQNDTLIATGSSVRDLIITNHYLHAFNHQYYSANERYISFS
ncbi:MAG: exodeoxyribonuclease V subunit gamma, partial [Fibrobacter sp.]|nr:exodeoxyribonuclease V subunit gamma [Fibrobacter sp.]